MLAELRMGPLGNSRYKEGVLEYGRGLFSSPDVSSLSQWFLPVDQEQHWLLLAEDLTFGWPHRVDQ